MLNQKSKLTNHSNIVKFDCGSCGLVNIYDYGENAKRKVLLAPQIPKDPKDKTHRCLICNGFECQRITQTELAQKTKCCHCEMIMNNKLPTIQRTDHLYNTHLLNVS